MGPRTRRVLSHTLGAAGMGAACTIATIPFNTGDDPSARTIGATLFVCSTILAAAIGACSSGSGWSTGQAARLAAGLAPLGGALNAVLTFAAASWISGQDPGHEILMVAVLGLPFGGLPGAAYSIPLALAIRSVRAALAAPARTSGTWSRLLVCIGLVAVATTWCALRWDGPHPAWPFAGAFLAVAALTSAAAALRGAIAARRLHGFSRLPHHVTALHDDTPRDVLGVPAILPLLGPQRLAFVVTELAPVGDGAYRSSVIASPALLVPGPLVETRRRLLAGSLLLGALSLLLGGTAAAALFSSHAAPPDPLPEIVESLAPPPVEPAPVDPVRWAVPVTGRGSDEVTGVATDAEGNILVGGRRQREPAGGGEPGVVEPTDAWIGSFGRDGTPRWEKRFRADAEGEAEATAIGASPDGTVYLAGNFQRGIDLGGGGALRSLGRTDVFLGAFSRGGAPLWSRRIGGALTDRTFDLAVDSDGRGLVLVGIRDAQEGGAAFVESWTASGRRRWSRTMSPGNRWNVFVAVAVGPGGEVVVAGNFEDDRRVRRPDAPAKDVIVYGLSPEGTIRWSRHFGGPSFDTAEAVAMDAAGNAWVSGSFGDQIDFGTGVLHESGGARGSNDAYVVSLGPDGSTRWAVRMGGETLDSLDGLVPGPEGALLAFGHLGWQLTATRIGADGSTLGVATLGGPYMEWSSGAAMLPDGELAVVGGFARETILGIEHFTAAGHDDSFVAAIRAP